ncbi:hypothetical protein M426DRAFT_317897 [Hypoxylon sp. CI-4A]|nr:hypothetical protein M426DRAFT_317897 [Hypoxylon sp. CI-4A]
MPLELHPATEADARRSAEIEHAAYAPNPFNRILFPGPFPPEALDGRAATLADELRTDRTTRWFKVVDTAELPAGEQMIAFAKLHVYAEKPRPTAPRAFGPGCNAEACELLFGGVAAQRGRILGDRPYVFISLLHTDPKHQGRGAGELLVRRAVEEAQRQGLVAYLESSESGHSLYKKCGFCDVDCLSVDLSRWGATEIHRTYSMMYDPFETASG